MKDTGAHDHDVFLANMVRISIMSQYPVDIGNEESSRLVERLVDFKLAVIHNERSLLHARL
jgi:hypothetical protein